MNGKLGSSVVHDLKRDCWGDCQRYRSKSRERKTIPVESTKRKNGTPAMRNPLGHNGRYTDGLPIPVGKNIRGGDQGKVRG